MLELVRTLKAAPQCIVGGANSNRTIGLQLLHDGNVHCHMQKWIGLAALERKITMGRGRVCKNAMILRMGADNRGDGLLHRFQDGTLALLTPHVDEHSAKLFSLLAENHRIQPEVQTGVFCRYSHKSRITQLPHNGRRAVHV